MPELARANLLRRTLAKAESKRMAEPWVSVEDVATHMYYDVASMRLGDES